MAKKDPTLEEIWEDYRKEFEVSNHPLSFTTKMFYKEFNISKTKALRKLNSLAEEGRVKKISNYYQKDKNGRSHAIPGWQWIVDESKRIP